jgi:hypothetical protein
MNAFQSTTIAARMLHPNVIKVVSIALAVVFGVLYIIQMNQASMKGYAMRDLENSQRNLIRENDKLGSEIDRLRSLSSIEERQAFLGLVPPSKIEYIKVKNQEVALGN